MRSGGGALPGEEETAGSVIICPGTSSNKMMPEEAAVHGWEYWKDDYRSCLSVFLWTLSAMSGLTRLEDADSAENEDNLDYPYDTRGGRRGGKMALLSFCRALLPRRGMSLNRSVPFP